MNSQTSILKVTLNRDIVEFAVKYKLSQRETDVFLLLLNRVSTSSDIAGFLGLSANTVSNHLKSILTKTRCHSKTELLGQFLEFQLERTESLHVFVRRPQVLIVANDMSRANALADALRQRGMEASVTPPATAGPEIVSKRVESVLYLSQPNVTEAVQFFEAMRREFSMGANTFLLTAESLMDIAAEVFAAVTEVIPIYFTDDQIAMTIVEHGIPDPYTRNRFVRTESKFETTINGEMTGTAENIAHGGLFISFRESQPIEKDALKKNALLEVSFTLPDGDAFNVSCRVAWVRFQSKTFLPAGVGIQFQDLSEVESLKIKEFVRRHKKLPRL